MLSSSRVAASGAPSPFVVRYITQNSLSAYLETRSVSFRTPPAGAVFVGVYEAELLVAAAGIWPLPATMLREGAEVWIPLEERAPLAQMPALRTLEDFAAKVGMLRVYRPNGKLVTVGEAPKNPSALSLRLALYAEAKAFVGAHHSHLSPSQGSIFNLAVVDAMNEVHAIAMVGRPVARMLSDATTAEITRVASDRTPHAASKIISASARACLALGFRRVISYTLDFESGVSYRAAGWWPTSSSGGGEWSRPPRSRRSVEQGGAKVRWEFGPEADEPRWGLLEKPSVGSSQ